MFAESLTNRLFDEPMQQLREAAAPKEVSGSVMAIRGLFGLQ